jgi:amidase
MPRNVRTLTTSDGSTRPYNENMKWIAPATLCGLPATSAPVGFTTTGLPVGIQIIGPYYEDLTPIDIASKLTELVGGFEQPPAYAG